MIVVNCSLTFRILDLGELLILLVGIMKSRAAHDPTDKNDFNQADRQRSEAESYVAARERGALQRERGEPDR